ncbi:MAG: helix-turn-helix domain-containing protein [Solirubrobacteraceae bacterium]
MGDKWTLLIVRDLLSGPRRFVELQRVLPGISTEQLRSRLNRMVADGMLTRKRYREVPPRVDYELTERSRQLAPVLGQLARWGYEWAWSAPRTSERVDLGAIFRLVPGLVDGSSDASGTIDLEVTDGPSGTYRVTLSGATAQIAEGVDDGAADSVVRGTTSAWTRALGPLGDREGLSTSGDGSLGWTLLDLLALGEGGQASVIEHEHDLESATG